MSMHFGLSKSSAPFYPYKSANHLFYIMAQDLESSGLRPYVPTRCKLVSLVSSWDSLFASSIPSLFKSVVTFSLPMFQPPFFITKFSGGLCSCKNI